MTRVRSSLLVALAACLFSLAIVTAAWAAPAALQLQWGKDTNAVHACDELAARQPIISVIEFVSGDVDSGFFGNWAMDSYTRQIQVYENGDGTYCASVDYQGSFQTIVGQKTPGAGIVMTSSVNGRMQGGYVGTITGTLLAEPTWPTRGVVGSYDYGCNTSGSSCKYVSWISQYFESGAGFDYVVWGWIYRGGKNGTWVNADTGSSGNIH